jgi:hypothetical protein
MTNTNPLAARSATMTSAQIEAALTELDKPGATASPDKRRVYAELADELSRRWDIDAELDRVFLDDEFDGTYYQAMLAAREARHHFVAEAP